MDTSQAETPGPAREDAQLVDLLAAVLADPNLHTDARMRLHHEITALLRGAHEDIYGSHGHAVHQGLLAAHGDHLPGLVKAVLVDPNLHTDTRMRLHREIALLLRPAAGRTSRSGQTG